METKGTAKEKTASQEKSFASKFINPKAIIDKLGIAMGSVIADFGCANGYFSLPIAEKIGEEGVVYCLDILPQCIEVVDSQAKIRGITNIITKRANFEKTGGSKLPDSSCDWVILKNVLFQNKDKSTILAEARRVLKEAGKILVIEWNIDDYSFGPSRELRISKEALLEIIQKGSLGVVSEIAISDFHYGLVLSK